MQSILSQSAVHRSITVKRPYGKSENFAIFDWNRRMSRKRYKIGSWLLGNVNRNSSTAYRSVSFLMTIS